MKRLLRKMSGKGDEVVASWDETTTHTDLDKIEAEFTAKMKQGFFAANLDTNELIQEFDPKADILLIPRVQGG